MFKLANKTEIHLQHPGFLCIFASKIYLLVNGHECNVPNIKIRILYLKNVIQIL